MFVPPLVLLGKRSYRADSDGEDDNGSKRQKQQQTERVGDKVVEHPSDAFRILRQPGDGACLFHSLACLSRPPTIAAVVRARVVEYMRRHADLEVQGVALSQWIDWESRMDMDEYCARMSRSDRWGGAIEISVYSLMNSTPVEVYERRGLFLRRIAHVSHEQTATANTTDETSTVVRLLYSGRSHYDAMTPWFNPIR